MVPVLFGVTLAVFSMLFLVPGDPVKMMLAEFVTTPDQVAQMRAQLHLDEPVLKQYGRFVGNARRAATSASRSGAAGRWRPRSPRTSAAPASSRWPSMLVAVGARRAARPLAALGRNSWLDVAAMVVALLGVAMPSFWLGLLLIFVFSLHLGWFPATGGGDLPHLVLPAWRSG